MTKLLTWGTCWEPVFPRRDRLNGLHGALRPGTIVAEKSSLKSGFFRFGAPRYVGQ